MRSENMLLARNPADGFKIRFSILPLGSGQLPSLVVTCPVSRPQFLRLGKGRVDVVKRQFQLIHVFS